MASKTDSKSAAASADGKFSAAGVQEVDFAAPASEETKALIAAKIVQLSGLRSQYIDAVKSGRITINEGDWIAFYGPDDYKIGKTWQDVIADRQDDC
jgi:hypothetical protein